MIKILVNSPKGGVGKTTLATNIIFFLLQNGYSVLALDLAQGLQMSTDLSTLNYESDKLLIQEVEAGAAPSKLNNNYQYVVADTDDSFHIIGELVDRYKDWNIVVPIVNERNGLERIPRELLMVLKGNMFLGNSVNITIIPNRVKTKEDLDKITTKIFEMKIGEALTPYYIRESNTYGPFFVVEDKGFKNDIKNILMTMGVI